MDNDARFESKLDKISDRLSSIDTTLAAQHQSLKDHMRRTELLEKQDEKQDIKIAKHQGYFDRGLGIMKFLGSITIVGAILKCLAALKQ